MGTCVFIEAGGIAAVTRVVDRSYWTGVSLHSKTPLVKLEGNVNEKRYKTILFQYFLYVIFKQIPGLL
jgi:hypothetical protein